MISHSPKPERPGRILIFPARRKQAAERVRNAKFVVKQLGSNGSKKYFFCLFYGKVKFAGEERAVAMPSEFGNHFEKGSKVFEFHISKGNPNEFVEALLFFRREHAAKLRELGFSGIYGDTTNSALVNFFKRNLAAFEVEPPESAVQELQANLRDEVARGLPEKYLNTPVRRIILKF